jgi:hypothetical protein
MAVTVEINGSDVSALVLAAGSAVDAIGITMRFGELWECTFPIVDDTGSTVPTMGHLVRVESGADQLFLGYIRKLDNSAATGTEGGHKTIVTAMSIASVVDRIRGTNDNWTSNPTVKAVATWIVTTYLSGYGITLDAGMATGPNVGNLNMTGWTVRAMLDHICLIADGWTWRIDPDGSGPGGELQVFEVGTITAASAWTKANFKAEGQVTWSRSREQYANRILLTYGPTAQVPKTWTVTGDGTTDRWPLDYTGAVQPDGTHLVCGLVADSALASSLPVGDVADPGSYYYYDVATNEIVRIFGDLPNGATATLSYQAQFPQSIAVEDAGLIASDGVWEEAFTRDDILDVDVATVEAEALLRKYSTTPQVVTVTSFERELPGTVVTLSFADRLVSGDFFINGVTSAGVYDGDMLWTYELASGTETFATWRATLKNAIGGGGSGIVRAGQTAGGATTVVRTIPRSDGRFPGEVVAYANVAGQASLRSGLLTGLSGGTGSGLQIGRGVSIDDGTWSMFAPMTGDPRIVWGLDVDVTTGKALALQRTDPATYLLLPALFENVAGGYGGYLGDPEGFTGLSYVNRAWAGLLTHYVQSTLGLFSYGRTVAEGEWQAYTPVWTATGTAPSLGNGLLTGRYSISGDTVRFEIMFVPGSTTTFGTGVWFFSLPVTGHADYGGSNRYPVSMPTRAIDNSTGSYRNAVSHFQTASTIFASVAADGAISQYGPTTPFTWAQDDRLMITGSYEGV